MGEHLVQIDLAVVTLILLAVIAIVGIWQIFAGQRRVAERAQDDRYRELAREATEELERTAGELTDLKQRVADIENVLKEVE